MGNLNIVNSVIEQNTFQITHVLNSQIEKHSNTKNELSTIVKVNRNFLLSSLMSEKKVYITICQILDYVNKPI